MTFSEKEWFSLLEAIKRGSVIPVLGPAVVSTRGADGSERLLYPLLAEELAKELGLPAPPDRPFKALNDVARAHLAEGKPRAMLYDELRALLKQHDLPGTALRALAKINGFNVIISSTPDDLMARALRAEPPGFDLAKQVFWFHTRGRALPHPHPNSDPNNLCDLPAATGGRLLYHLLGSTQTPDFAIWEEDYLEFICSLLERADQLNKLFDLLKTSSLLLIGAPSEDWIVRFFLRVARGRRLSAEADGTHYYLADHRPSADTPMTFFFEKASKVTRIIDGDPQAFAVELADRWIRHTSANGAAAQQDFFAVMTGECPDGAVFISYAREDKDAVEKLGRALLERSVPVWVDKQQIRVGDNFERTLEFAIKTRCSFFISLISKATERRAESYVHQERRWAAGRHTDGYAFYLPLVLDLDRDAKGNVEVALEPREVSKVHREQWIAGRFEAFVEHVAHLADEWRSTMRRPRN